MARWEHEDVSNLDLPDPEEVITEYYDKNYLPCDERKSIVKVTTTRYEEGKESKKQYIRFSRGEFIDPHSVDSHTKPENLSFKKVCPKTLEQYIRYLKTKNHLYFTRSRRLYREK